MPNIRVMGLCLALVSGLCAGCAKSSPTPPPTVRTSYPSPDYPAQTAAPAGADMGQASSAAPARPLYGPVNGAGAAQPVAPAAASAEPSTPRPAPTGFRPPQGMRPAGAPNRNRLFQVMDADHNGRVTLEEWRAFHEREFRRLDKNDDGVLTLEEMNAPPPVRPGGAAPRPRP